MVYYTSDELSTIKNEINALLSSELKKEIEVFKNTAQLNNKKRDKYIMLSMVKEILDNYSVVVEATDNIINTISEENMRILIEKTYRAFPTLKYPNFVNK